MMNKGINDLIKLIENETNKEDSKRMKQKKRSRQKLYDQFSFQPKINRKSQKMSSKESQDVAQRVLKGTYISNRRNLNAENDTKEEFDIIENEVHTKGCTFKPNINKNVGLPSRSSDIFSHLYSLGQTHNQIKEDRK